MAAAGTLAALRACPVLASHRCSVRRGRRRCRWGRRLSRGSCSRGGALVHASVPAAGTLPAFRACPVLAGHRCSIRCSRRCRRRCGRGRGFVHPSVPAAGALPAFRSRPILASHYVVSMSGRCEAKSETEHQGANPREFHISSGDRAWRRVLRFKGNSASVKTPSRQARPRRRPPTASSS